MTPLDDKNERNLSLLAGVSAALKDKGYALLAGQLDEVYESLQPKCAGPFVPARDCPVHRKDVGHRHPPRHCKANLLVENCRHGECDCEPPFSLARGLREYARPVRALGLGIVADWMESEAEKISAPSHVEHSALQEFDAAHRLNEIVKGTDPSTTARSGETPRTDAMWKRSNDDAGPHYSAAESMRDFSRELECELAAAKHIAAVREGVIFEAIRDGASTPSAIGRIDLTRYVNAADISAADVPHVVVEKLQRAIDRIARG